MDLDEFLEFTTATDELGLLKTKPVIPLLSADDHLLSKFSEIIEYVKSNDREPKNDMTNVPEFMLFQRLSSIRKDMRQCAFLAEFDSLNLLPDVMIPKVSEPEIVYPEIPVTKEINTLDDIFADDSLGILEDSGDSIFTMKHVPKERAQPDHVSRRKKCEEFDQFRSIFNDHHAGLKDGRFKKRKFQSELQITRGEVFVLDGMLVYIANIGSKQKKNFGNVNARLYCVFDNGTESNMYLRSLAAAMWKDDTSGQIVESNQSDIFNENESIGPEDHSTGYIYILESLSSNPEISSIDNLYKIGFSSTSVEKRIANAEKETTYLMAPVKHLSTYTCFNMNAQKCENLLHTFFGQACLNVEILDLEGKKRKPREWFIAPLRAIEAAIQLLSTREIVHYRYDAEKKEVVEREI